MASNLHELKVLKTRITQLEIDKLIDLDKDYKSLQDKVHRLESELSDIKNVLRTLIGKLKFRR